jgi:hypothetical protein
LTPMEIGWAMAEAALIVKSNRYRI